MRTEVVRAEIERLIHQAPFRPFAVALENGDRFIIEHPENIAFDPGSSGSSDFYVITGNLRLFSSFEAISSLTLLDMNGVAEETEGAA